MTLCFTHLFEMVVLTLNSLAILNDRRFLRKYGLDKPIYGETARNQITIFLYAIRTYLRFPLIILNILIIFFELIFG
ncbi:hypothetical protein cpbgf_7004100 [Cryptosporidium parvum]|uniref:Yos1-like protein n=1 Tax=Cryptosporidium parvum TaxID=5807 RepID=A0A7S7LEK7_CRYPV|nr:hypothetical protein CPATCC_0009960 [Cryptosporidium parvum]WRK33588.1 hypothetical protein cpbgf_7004100 [Cryptosporidium parvum]|eukprot:QOY40732.1 hypothetical protein CPATCC_003621 [Cryptosporidium parvum]